MENVGRGMVNVMDDRGVNHARERLDRREVEPRFEAVELGRHTERVASGGTHRGGLQEPVSAARGRREDVQMA